MLSLSSEVNLESLPVSFIERYRTADGPAIKVAFFLMLGNKAEPSLIAQELSLPLSTVDRCLHFWHRAGLLSEEVPDASLEAGEPKKTKPLVETRRLSDDESNRLLRNPEVMQLLRETQDLLGRIITPGESTRLLGIYQYDELPVEVILMIVAFSEPRAKRNLFGYVERIARVWSEDGINSIEKADKHLALIESREARYVEVAPIFSVSAETFTYREKEYINAWFEEYCYDIAFVEEACQRVAKRTVPTINRILRSWSEKGFRTLKETRSEVTNTATSSPRKRNKADDDLYEFAKKRENVKRLEVDN